MDIKELESFKLSDAIKFHDKLNPRLWRGGKLLPEVKKQLEIIAEDFITELGISGLNVEDITLSGSNAAYTYTPHSDLDLHILVDMNKLDNDEVYRELFQAKKTLYNDTHDIKIHGVPVELYVQDTNEPVKSLGEYSLLRDEWIKIPKKKKADFDQQAARLKYEKLESLIMTAMKSKKAEKIDELLKTIKRYRQTGLDKGGEFSPENLAYKALRNNGYIQRLYDLRNTLHTRELSLNDSKILDEGINDPAIFKVVFIIGGPGSGKSYISKRLGLNSMGYVNINSDVAFEYLMKKNDLNFKMPPEEKEKRSAVRQRAKDITGNKSELALDGRLGIIIDGTGDDFEKVIRLKTNFDELGYDNFLVIVNTRLDVARERNKKRKRTVPDDLVIDSWYNVQNNIGKFAQVFDNTAIIDNSGDISETQQQILNVYKKILNFTNKKPNSPAAREWINRHTTKFDENASGYIPSEKERNDPRFKTALTVDVKPDSIKKNAKAFKFDISRAGIPPLFRK